MSVQFHTLLPTFYHPLLTTIMKATYWCCVRVCPVQDMLYLFLSKGGKGFHHPPPATTPHRVGCSVAAGVLYTPPEGGLACSLLSEL